MGELNYWNCLLPLYQRPSDSRYLGDPGIQAGLELDHGQVDASGGGLVPGRQAGHQCHLRTSAFQQWTEEADIASQQRGADWLEPGGEKIWDKVFVSGPRDIPAQFGECSPAPKILSTSIIVKIL